jgi:LmbE family N-acetylglucosaminyl deacetylase
VQKKIASLKEEAYEAHEILGTTSLKLLDFPDNRFDSLSILDVAKAIEIELSIYKPDIVYTHHLGDLNIDHQITHKAVLTACRPFPEQSVKTIISFEVPSSTEWQSSVDTNVFVPNCFKSISTTIEKKLQSLAAYSSEMREWPHARSIIAVEHLASWRGASAGLDVAEAFIVIRDIHS